MVNFSAAEFAREHSCLVSDIVPPPGLAPPPGLTQMDHAAQPQHVVTMEPPPGLQAGQNAVTKSTNTQVSINGVPDKLLSPMMVDAMFEQIGLDAPAVNVTIRRCKPYGGISASFANARDAHRCVKHFQGRTWDSAGTPVQAEIVPVLPTTVPILLGTSRGQERYNRKQLAPKLAASSLSADAPVFLFSASSPAFVPVSELKSNVWASEKRLAESDTSTDLAESGSDDDSRTSN